MSSLSLQGAKATAETITAAEGATKDGDLRDPLGDQLGGSPGATTGRSATKGAAGGGGTSGLSSLHDIAANSGAPSAPTAPASAPSAMGGAMDGVSDVAKDIAEGGDVKKPPANMDEAVDDAPDDIRAEVSAIEAADTEAGDDTVSDASIGAASGDISTDAAGDGGDGGPLTRIDPDPVNVDFFSSLTRPVRPVQMPDNIAMPDLDADSLGEQLVSGTQIKGVGDAPEVEGPDNHQSIFGIKLVKTGTDKERTTGDKAIGYGKTAVGVAKGAGKFAATKIAGKVAAAKVGKQALKLIGPNAAKALGKTAGKTAASSLGAKLGAILGPVAIVSSGISLGFAIADSDFAGSIGTLADADSTGLQKAAAGLRIGKDIFAISSALLGMVAGAAGTIGAIICCTVKGSPVGAAILKLGTVVGIVGMVAGVLAMGLDFTLQQLLSLSDALDLTVVDGLGDDIGDTSAQMEELEALLNGTASAEDQVIGDAPDLQSGSAMAAVGGMQKASKIAEGDGGEPFDMGQLQGLVGQLPLGQGAETEAATQVGMLGAVAGELGIALGPDGSFHASAQAHNAMAERLEGEQEQIAIKEANIASGHDYAEGLDNTLTIPMEGFKAVINGNGVNSILDTKKNPAFALVLGIAKSMIKVGAFLGLFGKPLLAAGKFLETGVTDAQSKVDEWLKPIRKLRDDVSENCYPGAHINKTLEARTKKLEGMKAKHNALKAKHQANAAHLMNRKSKLLSGYQEKRNQAEQGVKLQSTIAMQRRGIEMDAATMAKANEDFAGDM